jgi:Fe-S-cluster containining protein
MIATESHLDVFRAAVYSAAGKVEVREAIAAVHAELERAIQQRRPRCDASGRCCRFEQFGHRLFVTTLELAAFVYDLETRSWPAELECARAQWSGEGCPFQLERLCGVHGIRPFGCRIFFCDPTASDWQREQYEAHHARLKRLHEELGVPYFYVEWRQALRAAGITVP